MKWIPLIFLITSLCANETRIQSKNVALKEKNLVLDGEVCVENAMGTLLADHAKLLKTSRDRISEATLRENVLLKLPSRATISCDSASLNFATLLGTLAGKERAVVYKDTIPGAEFDSLLEISCKNVRFQMGKHQGGSLDIQHLTARDQVAISYTENFSLLADYALYRKLDSKPCDEANIPQGMIKLYPKNGAKKCLLFHHNDRIESDHISIDTKRSQIAMTSPSGRLETREDVMTRFKAGQMVWDHKTSCLVMREHVVIDDPLFGVLRADKEMQIKQRQFDGKYYISTIDAKGPFQFTYRDELRGPHTFYSDGDTILDKDRLTFTSTISEEDQTTRYVHGAYEICAAKTHFSYAMEGRKPVVTQIDFEGDVCLTLAKGGDTQIAIADYLTYYPEEQEVTLSADPERRVLFSRENDSVRISAEELTISNRTETPTIHGVGRVKAFFDQDETNYYRQVFKKRRSPHETPAPGE